jgi:hypothetical protein
MGINLAGLQSSGRGPAFSNMLRNWHQKQNGYREYHMRGQGMEDVIQKLEEKRGYYQEQLEEIEEQIKKLDQALATLLCNDRPTAFLEPDNPATRPAIIQARTPWP